MPRKPTPAWVRDHPRVCGEKGFKLVGTDTVRGSPPRVRGKVPRGGDADEKLGITPACAGKSLGWRCV